MTVLGGCVGTADVSSQLHIVHTRGEPWNSFMKAAAQTFKKREHRSTPAKFNIKLMILSLLIFYYNNT